MTMNTVGTIPDVCGLALGGNVFGWTAGQRESFAVLDRYAEAGGNLIDTADSYMMWADGLSGAESETVLGQWIQSRGCRERVVIASKVGMWDQRPGLSAQNVRSAVEDSLRRLHTDYIDVYFAHIDDQETPQQETLEVFTSLIEEGKVREIGASNFSPDRLRAALEVSEQEGLARYVALEAPYNLVERSNYEGGVREVAVEAGLAVLPYYALAQGFLTGKYRTHDTTGESPRAVKALKYVDDRGLAVLAVLDDMAARHAVPVAAIALAWLRSRPEVAAPVASARTTPQLEEIMASLKVELTDTELAHIEHVTS